MARTKQSPKQSPKIDKCYACNCHISNIDRIIYSKPGSIINLSSLYCLRCIAAFNASGSTSTDVSVKF